MAAQRAHGERSSGGNHFWLAVRLVVLMAVVVVAGGVGIGSAGAASVTATPPPLLPAADQTEVPAIMQPTSLTLTPIPVPSMGATPQATVSGLTRDAKFSGQAVNVFDDAQGNPHIAQG